LDIQVKPSMAPAQHVELVPEHGGEKRKLLLQPIAYASSGHGHNLGSERIGEWRFEQRCQCVAEIGELGSMVNM
jgi:hypothetical protein